MWQAYARYFDFSGRSDRTEFWWFCFSFWLLVAGGGLLDLAFFGSAVNAVGEPTGVFAPLTILFSLTPSLAVTVRRLHDINRSGWWCLIGLIPILGFILQLVWMLTPGTRASNQFGSPPSRREPDLRHALEAGLDPDFTRPSAPLSSSLPRDDRFDKLERLAKLRDTDLLSENELQKLKSVNRRLKGTPYRRAIGTPLWCAACR